MLITIESPLAVAAAAQRSAENSAGHARALALPQGYFPPPSCLLNSPSSLFAPHAVQNIYVSGTECPQSPAPGCVKVFTASDNSMTLCAPAAALILVPAAHAVCPTDCREVTGNPAFAALSSQYGNSRVCQRIDATGVPVLSQGGTRSTITCSVNLGKFLCPVAKLPSGTYSVLWDKTPPPLPTFGRQLPLGPVTLTEGGPAGSLAFRITASDPNGLGGVEVVEVIGPGSYTDGVTYTLPTRQVWRADPALFAGAALKQYDSQIFSIPYTLADLPSRYFFARV